MRLGRCCQIERLRFKRFGEQEDGAKDKKTQRLVAELVEESAFVDLKVVEEMIERAKKEVVSEADKGAKSEIEKQIQNAQASFVTMFGIYASILSFLTIEFQFLKELSSINQIIGFTLILWAMLCSFNMVLDFLITNRLSQRKTKSSKLLIGAVALLFVLGLAFIILDKNFLKMKQLFQGFYHRRNPQCST